jgi:phosphoglycolate phosphatase
MKTYQYYIFDFDMTICDMAKGLELAYKKLFEHLGFQFREDDVKPFIGDPLKVSFNRVNNEGICYDDFGPYFRIYSDKPALENTTLFAEVKQVIDTMKSFKKSLTIVTNKNSKELNLILKRYVLKNNFQHILSIEAIGLIKDKAKKSNGILEYLKCLNVLDKEETIYIGNSRKAVIAANKAGIDYFCICRNFKTKISGKTWGSLIYLGTPYNCLYGS